MERSKLLTVCGRAGEEVGLQPSKEGKRRKELDEMLLVEEEIASRPPSVVDVRDPDSEVTMFTEGLLVLLVGLDGNIGVERTLCADGCGLVDPPSEGGKRSELDEKLRVDEAMASRPPSIVVVCEHVSFMALPSPMVVREHVSDMTQEDEADELIMLLFGVVPGLTFDDFLRIVLRAFATTRLAHENIP